MTYFSSDFKLGILGGGQLGKMLLTETQKWDIQTLVMDPSDVAPARVGAHAFVQGDLMDYEAVLKFGRKVNVMTIEIENVNVAALKTLEAEGVKVFPKPDALQIIQSKATQKQFYANNDLPTADFQVFQSLSDLKKALSNETLSYPFVWKKARFGYDGFGVKVIKKFSDFDYLPDESCIAEDLIPFKHELAVIVARNASGDIKTFPVVEMEFHPEANQVEYVICPARISESVRAKAQAVAVQAAKAFDFVGLLAVEMFQTQNDEVLINEVAPRPHNSGHYSIEAAVTSQFEQHLRAILNLPLGDTRSTCAGVMVNLVGAEGYSGDVIYEGIESILSMPGVTPHLYGKRQTRPFRKMGHVTIVHQEVSEARKIAEQVKSSIKVIAS
jgi:5-(carboxyamino)imidazole ribonucleotide synthase